MLEVYSASNNNTPPRLSLLEADYMSDKHKVVLESAVYARTFPQHHNLIALFRPIAAELEQALSGNKAPADALVDATSRHQRDHGGRLAGSHVLPRRRQIRQGVSTLDTRSCLEARSLLTLLAGLPAHCGKAGRQQANREVEASLAVAKGRNLRGSAALSDWRGRLYRLYNSPGLRRLSVSCSCRCCCWRR